MNSREQKKGVTQGREHGARKTGQTESKGGPAIVFRLLCGFRLFSPLSLEVYYPKKSILERLAVV